MQQINRNSRWLLKSLTALCAAPAMMLSMPAAAHHSTSMFDFSKCNTLVGTVRKLEWVYPHSWLWVVAPDDKGGEQVWGFEFMSPLQAMGLDPRWKRDALKKGDKVSVRFSPHREGQLVGAMAGVTQPDGHELPGSPGICGAPVDGSTAAKQPT